MSMESSRTHRHFFGTSPVRKLPITEVHGEGNSGGLREGSDCAIRLPDEEAMMMATMAGRGKKVAKA